MIASRVSIEPKFWLSFYAFFAVFLATVLDLVLEGSQSLGLITHMLYRNTRQQYKPYSTREAIMLSFSYFVLAPECLYALLPAWIYSAWTGIHELFLACFRLVL